MRHAWIVAVMLVCVLSWFSERALGEQMGPPPGMNTDEAIKECEERYQRCLDACSAPGLGLSPEGIAKCKHEKCYLKKHPTDCTMWIRHAPGKVKSTSQGATTTTKPAKPSSTITSPGSRATPKPS